MRGGIPLGQNRIEKIADRFTVGIPEEARVHAGDFVSIRPFHVMTHDNTGAVIPKFRSIGCKHVFIPDQPVFALDHDIQNTTPENLAKYEAIEAFAYEHEIVFFKAGTGIGHQIMVEEGFVLPGTLVVASDSHANIYGALCALGTPVVRTDAAAIWATGETWWQVPDVVKVNLTGSLRPGVSGKDVIIALIGFFKNDEVLNCAIEFAGDGIASLSMDQRFTIANMTTEWGALAGVFPYDEVTRAYLYARAESQKARGHRYPRLNKEIIERFEAKVPVPDPDAYYAKEFTFDLGSVTPHVAGPNEVKIITPLPEIEAKKIAIQKAYLLSCVNGRLQDLGEAAAVLKGKKVAEGVQFYLSAASADTENEARRLGYWQTLVEAGARTLPPGCGPCIGLGIGLIEDGETGISATNRNFKGRMGSRSGNIYLASPAVVAASALAGYIAAPAAKPAAKAATGAGPAKKTAPVPKLSGTMREFEAPEPPREKIRIREGFPRMIEGRILLIPKDNLNTDGIYGKDYTYKDNMHPDEMGKVAMLNYDPKFPEIAQKGDILVGGWNFGNGSSREQAATALKYRGIPLVIAGSYSQTYKRNAFNNGYIVIECPKLVKMLRERYASRTEPTIRTELTAKVDFESSEITVEGTAYPFGPLRDVAQELVALGGFEKVLAHRLKERRKMAEEQARKYGQQTS
jgi:homoaconitate hydratase